jgi:hypothetical protein
MCPNKDGPSFQSYSALAPEEVLRLLCVSLTSDARRSFIPTNHTSST